MHNMKILCFYFEIIQKDWALFGYKGYNITHEQKKGVIHEKTVYQYAVLTDVFYRD